MRDVLDLLTFGELELQGQLTEASNLALLGRVSLDGVDAAVMYKPVDGERPLWDFPNAVLADREAAAFAVSAAAGWGLVPPTVLRDGPAGDGSVQLWIGDPQCTPDISALIDIVAPSELAPGWLPVFSGRTAERYAVVVAHADRPDLQAAALLDAVINNGDRKGSHLVLDERGGLWGFDHGVSFHPEPKLRTVLWGWAGEPIPEAEIDRLERLATWLADPSTALHQTLARVLPRPEMRALVRRVDTLLRRGRFPRPSGDWPAVPWPPL